MIEAELQPLVTRCPDCSTQFKVSEAQLQVASGKVRCGSCLGVFEGVDNLVWDADFDADESADVTLDDLLDELKEEGSTPESEVGAAKANAIAELEWVADVETQSAPQLEHELGPELEPESEQGSSSQDNAERSNKAVETDTDSVIDPQVDDPDEEFDRELAANQIVQAANDSTEPHIEFRVELIEVPAEDELLDLGSSYIGPDYASLKRTPDQQEEQQRRSRNRRDAMAEMHALSAQREADEAATPIDETQIADTPASVPAVSEADLQAASATA